MRKQAIWDYIFAAMEWKTESFYMIALGMAILWILFVNRSSSRASIWFRIIPTAAAVAIAIMLLLRFVPQP